VGEKALDKIAADLDEVQDRLDRIEKCLRA
jgi:hypothetical protein